MWVFLTIKRLTKPCEPLKPFMVIRTIMPIQFIVCMSLSHHKTVNETMWTFTHFDTLYVKLIHFNGGMSIEKPSKSFRLQNQPVIVHMQCFSTLTEFFNFFKFVYKIRIRHSPLVKTKPGIENKRKTDQHCAQFNTQFYLI